jgi:phosphopantothenoylcysteine decarboxylase/phosphopantothenate--cysteine ligase
MTGDEMAATMYMRNPQALVAANKDGVVFVSPDGSSFCLQSSRLLICTLMELLREPRSQEEIERGLEIHFSEIEQVVSVLQRRQVLLVDTEEKLVASVPQWSTASSPLCQRAVVGISGAVQAALLIPLLIVIQRFIAKEVEIVLTEAAERFVRSDTLSYFGFRVWNDIYESDKKLHAESEEKINVPHIYLATSADLVLIAPATASTVHRLASGACSDLISLIVSATKAPVIVVPAMNFAMLQYPPVRKNIEELRSIGIYVAEPSLAFEVSKESDDQLRFSGMGLTETNIVRGIKAILAAHKEPMGRIAGNLEATNNSACSSETSKEWAGSAQDR